MEDYFEPLEFAIKPPLEFMMIEARKEESRTVRKSIRDKPRKPKTVEENVEKPSRRKQYANATAQPKTFG